MEDGRLGVGLGVGGGNAFQSDPDRQKGGRHEEESFLLFSFLLSHESQTSLKKNPHGVHMDKACHRFICFCFVRTSNMDATVIWREKQCRRPMEHLK